MATIKIAQASDASALAALARDIWEEHYTSILGEAQVQYMLATLQSEAAIEAELRAGKTYWLAQLDGEDAGYVSYELQEDQLFLSKFYLKSSARGKGLGRDLFEQLKQTAQKHGLNQIGLTVNKYNDTTIAVYKKLGFSKEKEQVADIGSGFVMDDYVLSYSF